MQPLWAGEPVGVDRPAHLQRYKLGKPVFEPRREDPALFDSGKIECPMVIRRGDAWWMYYTAIQIKDGVVHSTIGRAVSDDLIHWRDRRQVVQRGPEGAFDHGGISGPFVFTLPSPATQSQPAANASSASGRLYMVYIGFPRVGYESWPGRHGIAWSDDGLHWTRHPGNPVHDIDPQSTWDDLCLYKTFVMPHEGKLWIYYNARGSEPPCEQIGLAVTDELTGPWRRHPANPLIRPGDPQRDRDHVIIGDPWIMRHGEVWEMYYFGFDGRHARECLATSTDLIHWTKSPLNPILDAGPEGSYDAIHAHKPCIVVRDEVYYHFYTACGPDGAGGEHRTIGLATSRRLHGVEYRP